jgi:Radial spokehead-like protein
MVANAALLEAIGAGLGARELYGVMLAAKHLGEDPGLGVKHIRFFGKFLGTHADYYVFEVSLKEALEDETFPPGMHPTALARTYESLLQVQRPMNLICENKDI